MNRNLFLASLTLGLALLGLTRPSFAAETGSPNTIDRLIQEGWILVSPNVLQRNIANGKVETIGFGVEGLQFKIDGMKKDLAFFKESLRRNPDSQIRQTVQAYRAEIKRLTKNLALMAQAGEVTAKAGIDETIDYGDCAVYYGAHVDAFPLSGSQGAGASADSYFNSNCAQLNQQAEVWVSTTSEARSSNGTFSRLIKTDPLAGSGAPYIGRNVRAASSTNVKGVSECLSHAYASMTSYDIGIVYEQRAENRLCTGSPMSVTITGPTSAYISGDDCQYLTWNVSVSGGALDGCSDYTYKWYSNGYLFRVGSSFSDWYCGRNVDWTSLLQFTVTVQDSTGQSASDDHEATIYYSATTP